MNERPMNPEIQLICRDCGLDVVGHDRTTDPLTGKVTIRVQPCQHCVDAEWRYGYNAALVDSENDY